MLIVDKMGILAELYGSADAAYVGGALHHQVHNVLEPASYGLPLAFGPRYHNQREAQSLVEKGLAKVISDPDGLRDWLRGLSDQCADSKTLAAVTSLTGAAERIFTSLKHF